MKKLYFLFLWVYASCATPNLISNDYAVYRKSVHGDYTLLHAVKAQDTTTFVAKTRLLDNCRKFNYISKNGLNRIENTDSIGGNLIFTHLIKDANSRFFVTTGEGAPGQKDKEYVFTYSAYPYYVENCSSLKF
ncbi:MAG: hypothetical protein EOO87_22455 [Pedobacter sp.]|nr:MAG: hypothetical protein EOO87_22455 [Pedobacter sp.]